MPSRSPSVYCPRCGTERILETDRRKPYGAILRCRACTRARQRAADRARREAAGIVRKPKIKRTIADWYLQPWMTPPKTFQRRHYVVVRFGQWHGVGVILDVGVDRVKVQFYSHEGQVWIDKVLWVPKPNVLAVIGKAPDPKEQRNPRLVSLAGLQSKIRNPDPVCRTLIELLTSRLATKRRG